jgi:maleylacetate reductase
VGQNSPWEDAIEIAEGVRETKSLPLQFVLTVSADCILTLGGGSITDACKLSALLLENVPSPITRNAIPPLVNPMNSPPPPHVKSPTLPMIFVPTTLSAGEYHSHAGCLDREAGIKKQFSYPGLVPRWIICDAELASLTPEWVWLSTGMPQMGIVLTLGLRAVDHACESLCSTIPHGEEYDNFSINGLKLLLPGLLAVKQSPSLEAYSKCQQGAWNAIKPVIAPVPVQLGVSHAIGHNLGGLFKIDHGVTSCVMLPAVMQWNFATNSERQARVVEAFHLTGVAERLEHEGLAGTYSAADLLRGYIKLLGMPGSLTEVGVGPEKWELLAKETMNDPWTHTNPRKVNGPKDLMEIFELAK